MVVNYILLILTVYCVRGDAQSIMPDTTEYKTNIAPVFTSVISDSSYSYQVNFSSVAAQAKYLSKNGVTTVLVAGISGEGFSLGLCNRKNLMSAWVAAAKKYKLKVIANIGQMATVDTISYTKFCESIGVDACISSVQLFYLSDTAKAVVDDLEVIAKLIPNKCFFYEHIPYYTGDYRVDARDVHAELTRRVPNYCGIKASLCTCLQIRGEGLLKKNQICMVTNYVAIRGAWAVGFNSTVVPATTVLPSVVNQISKNVLAGKTARAGFVQNELNKAISSGTIKRNNDYEFIDVASFKYAFMVVTKIQMGIVIPPIKEVPFARMQIIKEGLQGHLPKLI